MIEIARNRMPLPPMQPPRRMRTKAEQEAWADGWNAAVSGAARHSRPLYLTEKEREAFSAAWDKRTKLIKSGIPT